VNPRVTTLKHTTVVKRLKRQLKHEKAVTKTLEHR